MYVCGIMYSVVILTVNKTVKKKGAPGTSVRGPGTTLDHLDQAAVTF